MSARPDAGSPAPRPWGAYATLVLCFVIWSNSFAAVRALVSESGCGQSELEQAMKVLEEKHLEAEEYDLYDPYG